MPSGQTRVPQARRQDLIIQQVESELVVLDRARDKAHVLNPTAAIVWQNCDGKRSIREVAEIVGRQTDTAPQEEVVWYTLARLQEQKLLDTPVTIPATTRGLTRREFITKFAVAAAVIPVVKTIQPPNPQQVASCPTCGLAAPAPCCPPNICLAGVCLPP